MTTIIGPAALLQAQSAYNTNSKGSAEISLASAENAVSFQKMVNKSFKSFANMKPEDILAVMKQARITSGVQNGNSVASTIGAISDAVRKDEEVKKRSIIGDASLSEVIAATSEAKTTLQTTVAARNKLIEMWNQVLNMPI